MMKMKVTIMMMYVLLVVAAAADAAVVVDVMQVLGAVVMAHRRWTNRHQPVCFLYEASTRVCMDEGCQRSVNCA